MEIMFAIKHSFNIKKEGLNKKDSFIGDKICYSNQTMTDLGVTCTCSALPMRMHAPWKMSDGNLVDHCSCYSDGAYFWLERSEWFRMELHLDLSGGRIDFDGSPVMFHGTEWGSAAQIVTRSSGFIVGPGTHSVRGSAWSGCWCVPTLADALNRADPDRYMFDGEYSRFSCPVVLEIQAAWLRNVPGSTMHCAPGAVGASHEGLVINAIHFNKRLMHNYLKMEQPDLRCMLRLHPFDCRRCACGLCGHVCRPESPEWNEWRSSRSKAWYHPRCYERVTSTRCVYW